MKKSANSSEKSAEDPSASNKDTSDKASSKNEKDIITTEDGAKEGNMDTNGDTTEKKAEDGPAASSTAVDKETDQDAAATSSKSDKEGEEKDSEATAPATSDASENNTVAAADKPEQQANSKRLVCTLIYVIGSHGGAVLLVEVNSRMICDHSTVAGKIGSSPYTTFYILCNFSCN